MKKNIFGPDQVIFLFRVLGMVAQRRFPHQDEFIKLFTKTLNETIKLNDSEMADSLFTEISRIYKIPYKEVIQKEVG